MVDILKEKYKHEPRICIICGKEYIPKRSDQRCCLDPECKKGLQLLNYKEYRATHYAKVLEANRRSMAKKREDAKRKETAEEKAERELRREQATNPALMPIGDPAGAA